MVCRLNWIWRVDESTYYSEAAVDNCISQYSNFVVKQLVSPAVSAMFTEILIPAQCHDRFKYEVCRLFKMIVADILCTSQVYVACEAVQRLYECRVITSSHDCRMPLNAPAATSDKTIEFLSSNPCSLTVSVK